MIRVEGREREGRGGPFVRWRQVQPDRYGREHDAAGDHEAHQWIVAAKPLRLDTSLDVAQQPLTQSAGKDAGLNEELPRSGSLCARSMAYRIMPSDTRKYLPRPADLKNS
ncbi:hypothetical protein GCM10009429_05050 [Dyella marensis]